MTTHALYRSRLPQLGEQLFITDAGLETSLIFHEKIDLPCFASCTLLTTDEGRRVLRRYFDTYADMARRYGVGLVLESVTWRANPDWGARLGFDREALKTLNRDSIRMLEEVRREYATTRTPIVISGNLGPRGDGYSAANRMTVAEAEQYHAPQIHDFAATAADMVSAFTMNYVDEAIGIVLAARSAGMPVAISFTVETDGRLPSGVSLREAVEAVDAATGRYAAYFMINCAHPTHFDATLRDDGDWVKRLSGIRANASCKSHRELDEATELDSGDPDDLGSRYRALRPLLPRLSVVGGCCGTDHRHVEAICRELTTQPSGIRVS
jgi:homocysteine S-methyltransferase